jgi:UDP-glucose 4-epimerase
MFVLVTGATGRIGSRITQALVRQGHRVRAFAGADHPRAGLIAGPQVEFAPGRLEDVEAVNAACRGVDAVYHLAAGLGSRGHTEEQIFEFNLRGTFNMLRAVRDYAPGCTRFVYVSSDAVYWNRGNLDACFLPIDESHPRLAGSLYGAAKIGCEELCLTFMRAWGIPVTILRFGATANADELINPQGRFALWLFLRQAIAAGSSQPNPDADQQEALRVLKSLDNGAEQLFITCDTQGRPEIRQWADARDVAEGAVLALTNPAAVGEVFNLGGPAPFGADEQVKYMAEKLKLPYVPARLPTARRPWYISSAKARGILGYQPRWSIFDMIDDAVSHAAR